MCRFWWLSAFTPALALATSCIGTQRLCEALKPGVVVFIGTPSPVQDSKWSSVVTFAVDEALWGLDKNVRTLRVRYSDPHPPETGSRFVIGHRDKNDEVLVPLCGGIELEANHAWVREFRTFLAQRTAATLPVQVVSVPNYSPVEFADVDVEGNGKRFTGSTAQSGTYTVDSLPPGTFTISATKPSYSLEGGPVTISVLPGACAQMTIRLKPVARISGRILDHLGRSVANAVGFDLVGWNVAQNERDYSISHTFKTDERGEFQIAGVMPGTYYLGANIWGQNHPKRSLLPQVLYPGTIDFATATSIIIREGDAINDLTFRLPDFGAKRRLEVRVVDEKGEPVPETVIENGPAAWDDRTMAAIEEKKTNQDGIAVFEIWAIAEYNIDAHWFGEKSYRQSAPILPWQGASRSHYQAAQNPVMGACERDLFMP